MSEIPVPFCFDELNDFFSKPPASDIRSGNTLDAGILLPYLVWAFKADICLEFGVYQAYTSSILMWSMQAVFNNGTLVCFDMDDEALRRAERIAAHFPLISTHLVKGVSGKNVVAKTMKRKKIGKAGLAYVDGGHSFKNAYSDLLESLRLIRSDGVIVAHDYFNKKNYGVVKAVDKLAADHRLQKFIMPHPRGASFAILRRQVDPAGKHGNKVL